MSNYGIKPISWGPKFWSTIFNIAACYPDEPDTNHINATKNFFSSMKDLLPCIKCKLHYIENIKSSETSITNNSNFNSRKNLEQKHKCLI